MPDKVTKILFGCVLEDMPECPDKRGWSLWLRQRNAEYDEKYRPAVNGISFDAPHISKPAWVGFVVDELKYGEVWMLNNDFELALKAWSTFMSFVERETGLRMPHGQLIVAHDE